MSTTFKVSEVKKDAYTRKPSMIDSKKYLNMLATEMKFNKVPEAYGAPKAVVASHQSNGLFMAVHTAFQCHMPLALSPDHVWIIIAREFAAHVTANAEALRKKFVDFEGKKQIEIRRDMFVKGDPDNDWEGAFAEFSEQIKKYAGPARDLIVCDFSTTGHLEKAASEVILMDAMQHYFEYSMRTCCGIPEITLLGTVDDWKKVGDRVAALAEYGLEKWVAKLLPVIYQFVAASEGRVDNEWWQSFYKFQSMSGSDSITGHFVNFFPEFATKDVFRKTYNNPTASPEMTSDDISHAISTVPFTWHYFTTDYDMKFVAGLPFAEVRDGVVRPAAGWMVMDASR